MSISVRSMATAVSGSFDGEGSRHAAADGFASLFEPGEIVELALGPS